MLTFNNKLYSDLSKVLEPDEECYVKIDGSLSTCLISVNIDNDDGSYVVQSSIDSTEKFQEATTKGELNWENIVVNGVEYPELTFNIPSVLFNSPNILYIKNTSAVNTIEFSLRGNR